VFDGEFEGHLTTNDTLIVAEQGSVLADIKAGTVICKGRITGNIIASQKVEIHSTGKILGDVQTPALSIEIGAVFKGNSSMFDAESPHFSMTEMTPVPNQEPVSDND
jgi:cytoskeletal protein CcmA (bactofilin family)